MYFLIQLKLFWCLRYAQRSHFASSVCPYHFPYKFGSCPYKNGMWKFKNLYLLKEFFDRFGVCGKVVGMDEDYTEKKMIHGKFFSWFLNSLFVTKNWFTKKHYFYFFFIFWYVLGDIKCQLFRKFQNGQKIFDRVMIFWKKYDFSKKSKKKTKNFLTAFMNVKSNLQSKNTLVKFW